MSNTIMADNFPKTGDEESLEQIIHEEGVHEHHPENSPASEGQEDVGGSEEEPTSDDSVDGMISEISGQDPHGKTIGDIVNEAERERRHGPETPEAEESSEE